MISLIRVRSNMQMVAFDENGDVALSKNLLEDVIKELPVDENTLLEYPLAVEPVKVSSWFDIIKKELPAT